MKLKLISQKPKRGDNNKYQGNPRNHQGLLENIHSDKLENLGEMDKLLDTYDYPKLN
jgi:hypothetical protein